MPSFLNIAPYRRLTLHLFERIQLPTYLLFVNDYYLYVRPYASEIKKSIV